MLNKQFSKKIILISIFSSLAISNSSLQNTTNNNFNINTKNHSISKNIIFKQSLNEKNSSYLFHHIKKTIKKNDSGIEVSNLQIILQWLGYYKGQINGNYDLKTIEAVKNLKTSLNLTNENEISKNDWILFVKHWYSQKEQLLNLCPKNIPHEYKPYISSLIKKHPNWIFQTYEVNDTWDNFIYEQTKNNRSMIHSSSPKSWINSNGPRNQWSYASKDIIYYFADPRNFFNEINIFQFEKLSFSESTHTIDGINQILKGTFMDPLKTKYNFAVDYLEAAKKYNISPYFLASKTKLELGINGNHLTTGTVNGFNGFFNFYNIGSYESNSNYKVLINGATKAKENNWNSIKKAILGGAKYISENYISKGQDTKYSQKYDFIDEKYSHQYVQNIKATINESKYYYKTYNDLSMIENKFIFKIPVFKNMSSSPKSLPLNSETYLDTELIKNDENTLNKNKLAIPSIKSTPKNKKTPTKSLSTATSYKNNMPVNLNKYDFNNIIDIKYHSNKNHIISMLEKENISLISKRFFPDNLIKKSEALVIILRSLNLKPDSNIELKFKDTKKIPSWSLNYFKYAVEKNIVNGNGKNELEPLKNITNEEFIKLIITSMNLEKTPTSNTSYSDDKKISSWAKGYINKAIELNILSGYDNFNPKNHITRSEICIICDKLQLE